jgi:arylamine N-acetyltransferase
VAWQDQYLANLGLGREPPSASYLARICRSHLTSIPFENLTRFYHCAREHELGYRVPPIEIWVENVSRYRHGGTCVELNGHLNRLLQALGFDSELCRLGQNHFAILARVPELANERLYVDCGSMAPLFAPIRLETDRANASRFGTEEVRIVHEEGSRYHYRRFRRERIIDVEDQWTFDVTQSVRPEEMAAWIAALPPPGGAIRGLRFHLWDLEHGRSLALKDSVVTERTADGESTSRKLPTIEAIETVIHQHWGRPALPVREAVAALASAGIDVFADRGPAVSPAS